MRLLFWREGPEPSPAAAPTPYDRWLVYARIGALGGALLLFVVSFVPLAGDWSAANEGADINVTAEFYTALDGAAGGGGNIAWDFEGAAARKLRERLDSDHDGNVSESEYLDYSAVVVGALRLTVVRNFEIGGVRVIETRGLIAELVNSSSPAHLRVLMSGAWAQRDAEIPLSKDNLVILGYFGDLVGFERIRERTIIVAAGLSTFTSYIGEARAVRVPGASIVVHTQYYAAGSATGAGAPAVHFVRFSLLDSSLVLLAPLAIAYWLGIRGPVNEREATGQRRVVPFHQALSAGFLLLLVSYFAGAPGLALWVGGGAFGAAGLFLAYRIYPAERRPLDPADPRVKRSRALGVQFGGREFSEQEFADRLGVSVDALRKTAAEGNVGGVATGAGQPGLAEAVALLDKAHGPLERPQDATNAPAQGRGLAAAREMLPKAVTPLELPDEETARPEGRAVPARAPGTPSAPPTASAPAAAARAPAAKPKTRVRCPGCKHYFEAEGARPLSITCPHCGRRGVLR